MKNKRTPKQKAYDIWKSIEYHYDNSTIRKFSTSPDADNVRKNAKKQGDECVASGRQPIMSVKGGQTVTEKKLETIRRVAKERRQYSDEQILEMKELYKNDTTIGFAELAEQYGCSISQISFIMSGEQYGDVGEKVEVRPSLSKCPNCDSPPMIKSNLTRFHGDKCKLKGIAFNDIISDYKTTKYSIVKLSEKWNVDRNKIRTILLNASITDKEVAEILNNNNKKK